MTMEPDGKMSVQWGTASNADTTTGQTAATPTDTEGTDTSANAGVGYRLTTLGALLMGVRKAPDHREEY